MSIEDVARSELVVDLLGWIYHLLGKPMAVYSFLIGKNI